MQSVEDIPATLLDRSGTMITSAVSVSLSTLYSSLSRCTSTWTTVDSLCCRFNGGLGTSDGASGDGSVTKILTSAFSSSVWLTTAGNALLPFLLFVEGFLLIRLPLLGFSSAAFGCSDWEVPLFFTDDFFVTGGDAVSSEFSTASWCLRKKGKL